MDLLDRLLEHDAWTTEQLLQVCATLADDQLDREFDIGHRTLRLTLDHIIKNMEIWTALMADQAPVPSADRSIRGMLRRLTAVKRQLAKIARGVADQSSWDEEWYDALDNPPQSKSFGSAIAHLITHSMHHRAQVLYMLRLSGVEPLPEGDVFSWEAANKK